MFKVSLEKDTMVFSAAHFITFNRDICESIHGHNYRVSTEVTGPLDENGYVVDFIALRDSLAKIVASLDHRVILPTEHRMIQVAVEDQASEVIVRFQQKRWVFPLEDCVLLPVSNTTAELLADYIGNQLIASQPNLFGSPIRKLVVAVDENRGQWGIAEFEL